MKEDGKKSSFFRIHRLIIDNKYVCMPLRGRSVKLDETLSRCQINGEEDEEKKNERGNVHNSKYRIFFLFVFRVICVAKRFFSLSSPSLCYLRFSIWFHGKWKFKFGERGRERETINKIASIYFFLLRLLLRMIDFEYYWCEYTQHMLIVSSLKCSFEHSRFSLTHSLNRSFQNWFWYLFCVPWL